MTILESFRLGIVDRGSLSLVDRLDLSEESISLVHSIVILERF